MQQKVADLVSDAVAQGARLQHGCGLLNSALALLAGRSDRCNAANAYCPRGNFRPVAPLLRFSSEVEAIDLANATQAGLAAYFYTTDATRMVRVAEALEYGIVGINEGVVSNEMAPFGGVKESGNGREGSRYGLDDYLEIKYLCLGGIGSA